MKKSNQLSAVALLFSCILLLPIQKIQGQVSGIKSIPGDYISIVAAISHIHSVGLSGHVILELQPGYASEFETFPITIPQNMPTGINATLTIRPAATATDIRIPSIFSDATRDVSIIEIYGSYINIDGRPGGQGTNQELRISSTAESGSAIRFINQATNNKISFCELYGANRHDITSGTESGVVVFEPKGPFPEGVFGLGPQDNTIEHCNIHGGSNGILAFGHPDAPNVGNKIINNNIYDFFDVAIKVREDGSGSSWTINENSIYNDAPQRGDPSLTAISFKPGIHNAANTIDGNFIGGSGAGATGLGRVINGIDVLVGNNAVTTIRNNTFKNMRHITTVEEGAFEFIGISINLNLNVAAPGNVICSGNQIGAPAPDIGIELNEQTTGRSSILRGIIFANCGTGSIIQNTIQNIRMTSGDISSFIGIVTNTGSNVDVSQNTIRQLDITSQGRASITALASKVFVENCNFFQTLHNNVLENMTLVAENGEANFTGIQISGRLGGNTGNVIGSATDVNSIMVNGKTASATGVLIDGLSEDVSVSDDIIANITATGTESATVHGVYFNGSGLVKISGNKVHHLSAPAVTGIFIQPGAGASAASVEKNTVIGINTNSGTGIAALVESASSLNFTAKDNTVSKWQTGVLITAAAGGSLQQTIKNNFVTGNQTGLINQTGMLQDATCNWWGDASGPGGAGPGSGDPVGTNVVFSPWATIPEFIAVNAGADQVIYTGYGPANKTLTPIVTACGTPTYLWSTGATTPSITVSPTATTLYSITVTDANGHHATDEIIVSVTDVRCGNKNDKVMVCHKESTTRKRAVCIAGSEVASHLAHGDALGGCDDPMTMSKTSQQGIAIIPGKATVFSVLQLYPNPANNHLQLQWTAETPGLTTVKVIDILGRIVLAQTVRQTKGNNSLQFLLPKLKNGNYFLQIQSPEKTSTVKLLIQY